MPLTEEGQRETTQVSVLLFFIIILRTLIYPNHILFSIPIIYFDKLKEMINTLFCHPYLSILRHNFFNSKSQKALLDYSPQFLNASTWPGSKCLITTFNFTFMGIIPVCNTRHSHLVHFRVLQPVVSVIQPAFFNPMFASNTLIVFELVKHRSNFQRLPYFYPQHLHLSAIHGLQEGIVETAATCNMGGNFEAASLLLEIGDDVGMRCRNQANHWLDWPCCFRRFLRSICNHKFSSGIVIPYLTFPVLLQNFMLLLQEHMLMEADAAYITVIIDRYDCLCLSGAFSEACTMIP